MNIEGILFIFLKIFYLLIHEIQRERKREREREREAETEGEAHSLESSEPNVGLDSRILGAQLS